MEFILAKSAGFCFGVSKAVNLAYSLSQESLHEIYTLGPIIHNKIVTDELSKNGVSIINDVDELRSILKNSVYGDSQYKPSVLIRAHGVSERVLWEINEFNVNIVDATCPFVTKIQKLAREKYNEGYSIVITGDKTHPEVIGINGWCNDSAIIISAPEDISNLDHNNEKYCVLSQTTFSISKWKIIINEFKKQFDKFLFFDTICIATVSRQEEAAVVAESVDLMIVIGDRTSSNTLKLFEICMARCPRTFLVESSRDLSGIDFININKVGITAGASTPEPVIREVIGKMSEFGTNTNDNFEAMLEESLTTLTTGETVKGNIIRVDEKGVFIDLGFKYEGFVAIDEFKDKPNVGDEVEAVVARVNDKDGEVTLSKRRIDSKKGIKLIEDAFENKTPITVHITEAVNGGLVGIYSGVRVFVPASQLASRFVSDVTSYLKKDLDVKIVTFEKNEKNRLKVVGSHKVIEEANKAKIDEEFWGTVEIGKVYEGKVRSLTSFGAFVDLGGIDGLVHMSELSWKKIKHPSEVVSVGDVIEVFVIKCDSEAKKISLGYKKDEDNPWLKGVEKYNVGDVVTAKVVKFLPFGVFVEIEPGFDGLVHISQISSVRLNVAQDVLTLGQEVEAKIVELNPESKRINLSIKEVAPIDPVKTEEYYEEVVVEEAAEVAETVEEEVVPEVTD